MPKYEFKRYSFSHLFWKVVPTHYAIPTCFSVGMMFLGWMALHLTWLLESKSESCKFASSDHLPNWFWRWLDELFGIVQTCLHVHFCKKWFVLPPYPCADDWTQSHVRSEQNLPQILLVLPVLLLASWLFLKVFFSSSHQLWRVLLIFAVSLRCRIFPTYWWCFWLSIVVHSVSAFLSCLGHFNSTLLQFLWQLLSMALSRMQRPPFK